jgi:protein-S-isoprenylcysteine O-methyltransferase Ste14
MGKTESRMEVERMIPLMSTDSAHKQWWQISEIIFGIPFLVAIGLQLAVPFKIHYGYLAPLIVFVGFILLISGVFLIMLARREFAKGGQPTDPGRPTTRMITTGVFSISRNPIYLGAVCFLAGISLAFNLPWGLIFLVPSMIACHYVLITPEERYLRAKFGEEYYEYATMVRRWIGRR